MTICRHCSRTIALTEREWIAPAATRGDRIWRDVCPENTSFEANHEPEPVCHRCGITIPDGQEQWAMADRLCPGCFDQ